MLKVFIATLFAALMLFMLQNVSSLLIFRTGDTAYVTE